MHAHMMMMMMQCVYPRRRGHGLGHDDPELHVVKVLCGDETAVSLLIVSWHRCLLALLESVTHKNGTVRKLVGKTVCSLVELYVRRTVMMHVSLTTGAGLDTG
jgi:hypothetical protein